jgi:hypothetical protein
MDNLLICGIVIAVSLVLAGVVAFASRTRVKKPKCTCYFVKRDNPYCQVHGQPVPAQRNGRRLL